CRFGASAADAVEWGIEPSEGYPVSAESKLVQQLFLSLDTRVTCPKCAAKFSLEEGFARQALERLEQSTQGALEALRQGERSEVRQREAELVARERGLEARIAQEAQARAQALFAADRQSLEHELAQKTQLITQLRAAELALRTEKSALQDRA